MALGYNPKNQKEQPNTQKELTINFVEWGRRIFQTLRRFDRIVWQVHQ